MKISFSYTDRVLTLPGVVADAASGASREQLAVILALASQPFTDVGALASHLSLTPDEVLDALAFWQKAGAITLTLDEADDAVIRAKAVAKNAPKKKTLTEDRIPAYSLEQSSAFLETHDDIRSVINSCSQILGKLLSPAEIRILVAMADYLNLSSDYLLLLCSAAAEDGKNSVRYIEKMAISLFDSGLTDYEALEAHYEQRKRARSMDGKLRKLFGAGERTFTKRENDCYFRWFGEWALDFELVEAAYDIAVKNTGKASLPYMDRILENWHSHGFKSVAEVTAFTEAEKKKADGQPASFNTFDTNEFFIAALKRSYGKEDKHGTQS